MVTREEIDEAYEYFKRMYEDRKAAFKDFPSTDSPAKRSAEKILKHYEVAELALRGLTNRK